MVNKKLWFLRENVFFSIPIISSLIERKGNRYVSFFQGFISRNSRLLCLFDVYSEWRRGMTNERDIFGGKYLLLTLAP